MQIRLFIQPLCNRQIEIEIVSQTLFQAGNIPHFFQRLRWNVGIDGGFQHIFADTVDGFADVRNIKQLITLTVDSTALIVSNVIVFQQLLTNIKVTAFHFALRIGNRFGHPWVFNRFTWLHTQFTHHVRNAIGGKNTHQRIFHRQIEA